jgi:hypothetical protein
MTRNLSLQKILIVVFLAVATFLVFSPVLKAGFLNWDDTTHLTGNDTIRSLNWNNVKKIFSTTVNDTYIPLSLLSYALEFRFFAYNPLVYHLDNLLLHIALVILVFYFAMQMGLNLRAAFIAALLFAVHPMRVESVAWITERKDMLYGIFYVLALMAYWQYLKNKKLSYYIWALVCCLFSIAAKPMAFSLPFALFLFDWFVKRQG